MESYQKELENIKKILRENTKGMTVSDIAKKINTNRNSVAKYLDILLISGHADMITFGPAKVFFPSRRIPISSMLNLSSDYILVLDRDLKIVQVNDSFLKFANTERQELQSQRLQDANLPIFNNEELFSNIKNVLEQKENDKILNFQMDDKELFFKIKIVATTFDDGEQGVAITTTNITDQKRVENALKESEEKFKYLFKKIREINNK